MTSADRTGTKVGNPSDWNRRGGINTALSITPTPTLTATEGITLTPSMTPTHTLTPSMTHSMTLTLELDLS